MKKSLYLILAILGTIIPYTQFVPFTNKYGFDVPLMLDQMFATTISTGIAYDALFTALVLIIFILIEQKKNPVRLFWIPIVGIFAIGLSFAFPFYLYLRERSRN
ncbi:MAG: DUF2834 domain-containing protein [Patescibacteria group bacterium]